MQTDFLLKKTRMPKVLQNFLESLEGQNLNSVENWLNDNRYAVSDMLYVLRVTSNTREREARKSYAKAPVDQSE